ALRYRGRKEDDEILMADIDAPVVVMEEKIKSAFDCSIELHRAYGPRGLVIVEALNGQSEQVVADIQGLLKPELPKTLPELQQTLLAAKNREYPATVSVEFRNLLTYVINSMLQSTAQAISYQTEVVRLAEGELEARKLPGGVGRPGYTSLDLRYFET